MGSPERWFSRLFIAGALCVLPGAAQSLFGNPPPNIVLFYSDDAGYNEFGFHGSSDFRTPNLDGLAAQGLRFTSGYMSAPICSPARAGLLTGRYQQRFGYERNISNGVDMSDGMSTDQVLLFDLLKSLGYTIGVVGKWHLGANDSLGQRPHDQGVDEFYGVLKGSRPYWAGDATGVAAMRRGDEVVEAEIDGQYVTDVFGEEAAAFIQRHHDDPLPFFLYLSFTAPHGPYQAKQEDLDQFPSLSGRRKTIAAMIVAMDRAVGKVLDTLAEHRLEENTIVIFTNDNGGTPENDNHPLRGVKGNTWEGGIRVPFLIRAPGVGRGVDFDAPITALDVVPTLVRAAGGEIDGLFDGVDLMPHLSGAVGGDPHEFLHWRSGGAWAVRQGPWKLVRPTGGAAEYGLYDLDADIGETTDLKNEHPDKVRELLRELTAWEVQLDKPRWGTFGAVDRNLFDHFVFRPETGAPLLGENLLDNPGFEEGVQTDEDERYTYDELLVWTNASGRSDDVAARPDNPKSGAYRGMVNLGRSPSQTTDHLISLGEQPILSFFHRGFSGWDDGDDPDTIDVELFYVDGAGTERVLFALNVDPTSDAWSGVTHSFDPITAPDAEGQALGVRFIARSQSSEFASIDDVWLALESQNGARVSHWSWDGAWRNGASGQVATMRSEDAYANAVLEFPLNDAGSYESTNDMTRGSGQTFMLNELRLSGEYSGREPHAATINGNGLLFVDSRSGAGPRILLDASHTGTTAYAFHLDLDVVLYDDLVIAGDSGERFQIDGAIRDFSEPRSLTKNGASSVTLTGPCTYSGATSVLGGTLRLEGSEAALTDTARVTVGSAGTLVLAEGAMRAVVLDVSSGGRFDFLGGTLSTGEVVGDLVNLGGNLEPGWSKAVTPVRGAYTHFAPATLSVDIGGTSPGSQHDRLAVSGNAAVDGTLAVELIGGFIPAAGQRFTVLTCASLTGAFHTTNLPALPDDLEWQVEYESNGVDLRVVAITGGLQLPGDCNQDGSVNISDPICVLGFLFLGTPRELPCGDTSAEDEGNLQLLDWNGDGRIDVSDPVTLLAWLFLAGPEHVLGAACRPIRDCPVACDAGV